jgi:ADP-heptose:LPS heptosyltransferase
MPAGSPSILVIRRDNIGDLVCTTPLLHELRRQLPRARIECLVTRYNQAVLANHPDIDALHAYTKAKHRDPGESVLGLHWQRLRTVLGLRRQGFDWVLLPGGGNASALRFARWVAGRQVLVRDEQDQVAGPHEVEQCCHLLSRLGLAYETPAPHIVAAAGEQAGIRRLLPVHGPATRLIGIHISARKPSQRWPAESFADLARRLAAENCALLLLWAPGRSDNPQHPGDDDKAETIMTMTKGLPITPVPTRRLEELIAALSLCDGVVCGDGGAMHLAAGLGKSIVCLFGQSTVARWHPWAVPHVVLQDASLDVSRICVDQVMRACHSLFEKGH